jgi:glucokinase
LKHASLSSNDGLEINVEGSEKMRSCAFAGGVLVSIRRQISAGAPRHLPRGKRFIAAAASFAPGTGLGESFLTWDGSQYLGHGSEGGHSDFAPTDERQIRLLHHLLPRFGDVGVEHDCSGIGVPNIYEFLRDEENILERLEIAQLIESAKDHTNRGSSFRSAASKRIVPGDG